MNVQNFENLYQTTYDNTLRFIVIKCNNIEDINDIIQDTYIELYRKLKKSDLNIDSKDEKNYIIGIAKNIIKRHYRKINNKNNEISLDEFENIEINANIDLQDDFITQDNAKQIWEYIEKKDIITAKIFYLYYILDYKIEDISKKMELNISNVKARLYRTLNEMKNLFGKEMI